MIKFARQSDIDQLKYMYMFIYFQHLLILVSQENKTGRYELGHNIFCFLISLFFSQTNYVISFYFRWFYIPIKIQGRSIRPILAPLQQLQLQ